MGCSPFANSRFQMGVTVMGFAEDFGLCNDMTQIMKFVKNHGYCNKLNILHHKSHNSFYS